MPRFIYVLDFHNVKPQEFTLSFRSMADYYGKSISRMSYVLVNFKADKQ